MSTPANLQEGQQQKKDGTAESPLSSSSSSSSDAPNQAMPPPAPVTPLNKIQITLAGKSFPYLLPRWVNDAAVDPVRILSYFRFIEDRLHAIIMRNTFIIDMVPSGTFDANLAPPSRQGHVLAPALCGIYARSMNPRHGALCITNKSLVCSLSHAVTTPYPNFAVSGGSTTSATTAGAVIVPTPEIDEIAASADQTFRQLFVAQLGPGAQLDKLPKPICVSNVLIHDNTTTSTQQDNNEQNQELSSPPEQQQQSGVSLLGKLDDTLDRHWVIASSPSIGFVSIWLNKEMAKTPQALTKTILTGASETIRIKRPVIAVWITEAVGLESEDAFQLAGQVSRELHEFTLSMTTPGPEARYYSIRCMPIPRYVLPEPPTASTDGTQPNPTPTNQGPEIMGYLVLAQC